MLNNYNLKTLTCGSGKQKFRLTNAVLQKYEADTTYFGKSHGYANFGTDFKTSSSL